MVKTSHLLGVARAAAGLLVLQGTPHPFKPCGEPWRWLKKSRGRIRWRMWRSKSVPWTWTARAVLSCSQAAGLCPPAAGRQHGAGQGLFLGRAGRAQPDRPTDWWGVRGSECLSPAAPAAPRPPREATEQVSVSCPRRDGGRQAQRGAAVLTDKPVFTQGSAGGMA